MSKHLHRDLDQLRHSLLELGRRVEKSIHEAEAAFRTRDTDRAQRVMDGDRDIDIAEVRLEEDCLKILALHHPVAVDLRFVVAALKVNNDLERMGDAAHNISERAIQLHDQPEIALPEEFKTMVRFSMGMTSKALDCLLQEDPRTARGILDDDDVVDNALRKLFDVMTKQMMGDPAMVAPGLLVLSAARQFERIADLSTNIAEDVLFLLEGEIARHRGAQFRLM